MAGPLEEARLERVTRSAGETRALAARLSGALGPGAVVALTGELGAGKTEFVKGLAEGLGAPARAVRSPTFVLHAQVTGGRLALHHLDAYRLSAAEFAALAPDELYAAGGVVAVEWADRVEAELPDGRIEVALAYAGEGVRSIVIRALGEGAGAAVRALHGEKSGVPPEAKRG